ncbi:hypothetical protein [Cellulophaga sp. HaHa_2_1]|nr:hypothetical protein [Cellulophaga sp. HaHa_2_1]QXP52610.1 hypothetical protein H0I24_01405 [Cellulophaga sp. HaHa_2_1]
MKIIFYTFLFSLFQLNCIAQKNKNNTHKSKASQKIECTDNDCSGTYAGPEFIDQQDIAHQFSNAMSAAVGDQLKKLYSKKKYKKVSFSAIQMSTKGMGSGQVVYALFIPFISVNSKCEAYTSFDHVGGWNHKPSLNTRKKELEHVTMKGHHLEISSIQKTPEGLQEYWIQWKNKKTQSDCN